MVKTTAQIQNNSNILQAINRLHAYTTTKHWDGKAIVGPDPIGRIHWRITRFIRSYFPWLPGDDRYVYLQGQGYWIKSNLALGHLSADPLCLGIARQSADYVLDIQRPDGAWNYPELRERKHLICSIEGLWAGLGLIAAYQQWKDAAYLEAAQKWYSFQINQIGFADYQDGLGPNFYDRPGIIVPNVATLFLWFVAALSQSTGDDQYLEYVDAVVRLVQYAQMDNGELEYHFQIRPHFMCYQYNSFQFLDLSHYFQITGDQRVRPILSRMAQFLSTGVTERGSSRYNCFKEVPEVNYWTAVLAAALRRAHELGLGDYQELSKRAYRYLLTRQRPDGGFDFSKRNYGFLRDRRSYPRYLAMILYHLLCQAGAETPYSSVG